MDKLLKFNRNMGFVHLTQALIMVILALFVLPDLTEFEPRIIVYFMDLNENFELITSSRTLFRLPFALITTGFLFLSAGFHFLVYFSKEPYLKGIKLGYNTYRWIEYALSSSLLISLLAVLFGVRDIQTLSIIFIANATMNLLGLEMEKRNVGAVYKSFLPYWIGWLIGLAPWAVILTYLFFSPGLDLVPWYAWASIISYFAFFNSFALNMWLQYKKSGPWKDYVFGERVYIWLSLIAKSTIAWIVFTGAIQTSDIIGDLF
jgi:hypothetical protein